ncbi:MAG: CopG family transcriptional regulator [Kiritimatiellae bacterium]|nr:CopG family transcriptional regulator [Kiritimatiellia bacterium]
MGSTSRSSLRVITFKAEQKLAQALQVLPNRSSFIRAALLHALDHICPLCGGSGVFTPDQRRHWRHFEASHAVRRCRDCHAVHVVCRAGAARPARRHCATT